MTATRRRQLFASLALVALVACSMPLVLRYGGFGTHRHRALTMAPAVLRGDVLLVDRHAYGRRSAGDPVTRSPARGELVEYFTTSPFSGERVPMVKRVVGLPGDRVVVRAGRLSVCAPHEPCSEVARGEGDSFEESLGGRVFRVVVQPSRGTPDGEWTVVPGRVFVLNDSRDSGIDSRVVAWADPGTGQVPIEDITGRVEAVLYSTGDDGVRWERTFARVR